MSSENQIEAGIKGWLAFFVFSLIVINPVWTAFNIVSSYSESVQYFQIFPALKNLFYLDTGLGIALMAASIFTGISLYRKSPWAVNIAKNYLVSYLTYALVSSSFLFLAKLPPAAYETIWEEVIKNVLRSAVYFSVWFSYLTISRRVAITFPSYKSDYKFAGISVAVLILSAVGFSAVASVGNRGVVSEEKSTQWQRLSSAEGRFSILFPGNPQKSSQDVNTDMGMVTIFSFMYESPDQAFIASYMDYPTEMVEKSDPGKMLDGAVNGSINNINGKLKEVTVKQIGGYPGRSYYGVIENKSNNSEIGYFSNIYLVKNRLYQLAAVNNLDNSQKQTFAKFFDSFEMVKVGN